MSNDSELEKQHLELGIEYVSRQPKGEFNDSEALIYDIARYLEGDVSELTAQGSIAFIVIKRNAKGKAKTLFFGRNSGNPLKMKKTKHSLTLSSQGEGKDIEPNQLYSYDYETGKVTQRYLYIPYYEASKWNAGSEYYGGYGNYGGSQNFNRPAWDDEEAEESKFYDNRYANGYSAEASSTIIQRGGFYPRKGTQSNIEHEMMTEAMGDYTEAAMIALVEAEEANTEEERINDAIYSVVSNEAYDDLCDYWYTVNAYKGMMAQIADKFEKASVTLVSQSPLFESDSGIIVTPEERSLLPLNLKAV